PSWWWPAPRTASCPWRSRGASRPSCRGRSWRWSRAAATPSRRSARATWRPPSPPGSQSRLPRMELLRKLSEVAGVPGREEKVREIIEAELEGVVDAMETDAMGNLHAVKRAKADGAPRAMIAAHMDEIGFLVKFVDDKGFLRVQQLGGFDPRNLFARQVTVHASLSGEELVGVMNPSGKPIHISTQEERSKVPQLSDFFVDLGLGVDDVKAKVRVGDMVTLRQEFHDLGEVVTGKALDDRVGCWVAVQSLKRLQAPAFEVHAVLT